MRASSCASFAAVAFVLCGCAGVKVKEGSGSNAKDVNGIPFYIKVPWRTQETELASREMIVTFTVTEVRTDGDTGKTTDGRSVKLPAGATLRLDDTAAGRNTIAAFVNGLSDKSSYDEAVAKVKDEVSGLAMTFGSTQPATAGNCQQGMYDLVANSWSTKMLPGTQLYYIEPQNPFIGSASADIHIGDDGTLSESSTSVTDNTASTLLSLIPVSSLLSKAWGLDAVAPAAAASASAKALAHRPAGKPPTVKVRVDAIETPARTLYQLRQVRPLGGTVAAGGSEGLKLCDALKGLNDTELVSVKTLPADDDDKGDDAKNAWQIAGKLVPPKEDKPDKAGKAAKK